MPWANGSSRTSTAEHQTWARRVLQRAGYRCQIQGPACAGLATIADHITPDAEGGTTTLANGQAACKPCHDAKTRQEAARGQRRFHQAARRPRQPHPGLL